ncbi:MAG: DNA ligase [Planctomycetota bacterium]
MADLEDGESTTVQGSARDPYVLKNEGGFYSCTCPAWLHQSRPIDLRTCKHLKQLRGAEVEAARVGAAAAVGPVRRPRAASASARTPADQTSGEGGEAPALLLAHSWEGHEDPTGWWMSEKLDGVRAFWDGQRFVSRLGNLYLAPEWFTAGLPRTPLDGELWIGRGEFQRTVSAVRRARAGEAWKEVRYLVFDAPAHGEAFEARHAHLRATLGADHTPYASVVDHTACEGRDHLREELARVEALGGEGLMLRQPGSRYERGRSQTLLKVKSFLDAEARVLEHLAGRGKHDGRLGALRVVTPAGVEFSIGTGFSDAERGAPPPIGSVVTYRYQELTNKGVPRFPTFVRERGDVEWEALCAGASAPPRPAKKRPARPGPSRPSAPGLKPAPEPAPEPAPSTPDDAPAAESPRRRFELVGGGSSKFWEVRVTGSAYTVRFGRIGTSGREQTKTCASPAAARAAAEKLVSEKLGKGYEEAPTG